MLVIGWILAVFAALVVLRVLAGWRARVVLRAWLAAQGMSIMLCRSLSRAPWPLPWLTLRVLVLDEYGRYRNGRARVLIFGSGPDRVTMSWD